ncbi:MAG: MerR family transcriptional regulator [Desulfobulbaceae bacterium]|nr:MerR family transcriptional regulator [Desulfobulbaceae bacterium]
MTNTSCDNLDDMPSGADDQVIIPDKRYFKIGEVCEITGVKQHVLRYWESEFKILSPQRARSKQRLYRKVDVENILKIRRLLKDEGFTISGAQKALAARTGGEKAEGQTEPESHLAAPSNEKSMVNEVKAELLALKEMLEK